MRLGKTATLILVAATMLPRASRASPACDITEVDRVISECDSVLSLNFFLVASLRGYCYLVGGAGCVLF